MLQLMTQWIKARIPERSTKFGMALVAVALGMLIPPETAGYLVQACTFAAGVFQMIRDESNG